MKYFLSLPAVLLMTLLELPDLTQFSRLVTLRSDMASCWASKSAPGLARRQSACLVPEAWGTVASGEEGLLSLRPSSEHALLPLNLGICQNQRARNSFLLKARPAVRFWELELLPYVFYYTKGLITSPDAVLPVFANCFLEYTGLTLEQKSPARG